jgi:hypothetical protein
MRHFKNIPWKYIEFTEKEEVFITHPEGVLRLQKLCATNFRTRGKIPRLSAEIIRKDGAGIAIHLCLTYLERLHLVSEYLSISDIESLKIGTDGNTYIVVKKQRYDSLWKRKSVMFALMDIIGTKGKLEKPLLLTKEMTKMQNMLDDFASTNPEIAILSFADSLIVKTTWSYYKERTYNPELFLETILTLKNLLRTKLKYDSYAIITQGQNFTEAENILHIKGNHVGMLSLGYPFASLFEIDKRVRDLKPEEKRHIYMEDVFYLSLVTKELPFLDISTKMEHVFSSPLIGLSYFVAINEM